MNFAEGLGLFQRATIKTQSCHSTTGSVFAFAVQSTKESDFNFKCKQLLELNFFDQMQIY